MGYLKSGGNKSALNNKLFPHVVTAAALARVSFSLTRGLINEAEAKAEVALPQKCPNEPPPVLPPAACHTILLHAPAPNTFCLNKVWSDST